MNSNQIDNNNNSDTDTYINQDLFRSLLSDTDHQRTLSETINFSDPSSLLSFKANPVLPVAPSTTATSRIEGPYLKTYEINNQLPTPMNSFVESIYPLSELNNQIIQDINPFHSQTQPKPSQIFNRYAPTKFTLPNHMNTVESPPEPTRNFEEEANNLTRRIMEGNLKAANADDKSFNKLLRRQNITCVEDLVGKKYPRIKKPKVVKRAYRRRAANLPNEDTVDAKATPTSSPVDDVIGKPAISPPQMSNLTTPSDLHFDLEPVDSIQIDNFFETGFMESPEFKNTTTSILDTSLDELVNNNPILSSQDINTHIPSSEASPSFSLIQNINSATPVDKTFDISAPNIFSTKSSDILLTPSSASGDVSLVDQIKNDKALFEAISKKQKRGSYKCAHCPQTFPNLMEYAVHMDEFNIEREFKCPFPLCPWKVLGLPRRSDLRRHCAIQHKDELHSDLKNSLNLKDEAYPTILCSNKYCEKEFHRKDAFNRHVSIVHENKKSRFNKKLALLLHQCPENLSEEEKVAYIKENVNKKKPKNKKQK